MKKPPKNMDTLATKATSRLSKKTVLTIAPVQSSSSDCYDESHDNSSELNSAKESSGLNRPLSSKCSTDCSDRMLNVSPEIALAFSCKAMATSLRRRSWDSRPTGNDHGGTEHVERELEELLNQFEENSGANLAGPNSSTRLASLLELLSQGELMVRHHADMECDEHAKSMLTNSVHALIASESHQRQFDQAVETACQRAIYQFAYGLTHEINNPLANIAARAQQLISAAASDSDRRSLATIVDQSMRAHEMLAEMMRVVQPRSIQPRVDNVVAIVQQAIELQEKQWSYAQVACTLRAPTQALYGYIERASMIEAICSLLQNAMQVCRPNDRIEIVCEELAPEPFGRNSLGTSHDAKSDRDSRIRIAIRDTGPGMNSQTLERAWDLYFSGREHGRGLGISLAKVRQTIDAHGGEVWMQSKPDSGCTIEIRLPKMPVPPNPRKAFSI